MPASCGTAVTESPIATSPAAEWLLSLTGVWAVPSTHQLSTPDTYAIAMMWLPTPETLTDARTVVTPASRRCSWTWAAAETYWTT